MNPSIPFIVLVKSVAKPAKPAKPRWLGVATAALMAAALLIAAPALRAQTTQTGKIASDLHQVIAAPTTPALNWAKEVNGIHMVKALVTSHSSDPELVALRNEALAKGGSV